MNDKKFIREINLRIEKRSRLKAKQSPSLEDELRTKQSGELLVDATKSIIGNSLDPVKLITAQIRYRILVAKMYRKNARVK